MEVDLVLPKQQEVLNHKHLQLYQSEIFTSFLENNIRLLNR